MAVYDKNGNVLNAVYDKNGTALQYAYDKNGVEIFGGGESPDYDEYSTEHQHTILQARDEWKTKYRADDTVIPLLFDTDQHGYYKYATALFTYLGQAIKWPEVSAHVNLGDTCGGTYTIRQFNEMVTCLTPIPKSKQINIWGNHDIYLHTSEGDASEYGYHSVDDATYTSLLNSYFDNSKFGTLVKYGNRQNSYLLDTANSVKYCIFSTWYFDQNGDIYYDPRMTAEAVESWITMLSSVDSYDVILLMHIQPYYYNQWYKPAVDGNEASILSAIPDQNNKVVPRSQLNQLIADRKAKTSGTIVDYGGVSHSYDFSNCTSDILCAFAGHRHEDIYQWDANGTVPVIVLDAMGYDNHPFYMVNVDRTNQLVDVWKVDDSPAFYNFQIPFTRPNAVPD